MRVRPWAEVYTETKDWTDTIRWVSTHDVMIRRLVPCHRLLEVGTGTAMLAGFLSRFVDLVVSTDIDEHVQAVAQRYLEASSHRTALVRGDGFRLPYRDDGFDAVYSQGLLEHFSDEECCALITEGLRVAPTVYASVPSAFYPHIGRRGPGLVGNERLLRCSQWRRILQATSARLDVRYYPDPKVASVAGFVVPWPTQLLIVATR